MQFLKTVQKKDQAGVQAMLTEDFQIQMPDADLLAGDDWPGASDGERLCPARISASAR
jgi:hypothetical protein